MLPKELENLKVAIENATEGMTVLEKALFICKVINEEAGTEYVIDAKIDGGFTIRPKN